MRKIAKFFQPKMRKIAKFATMYIKKKTGAEKSTPVPFIMLSIITS